MAGNQLAAFDIIRLRAVSKLGNQVAINTINFVVNTVGAPPITDQDVADEFGTVCGTAFRALQTNGATYDGCSVQIIQPLPVKVASISLVGAGNGTAGTTPIPTQVSGVLTWQTVNAGRKFRGRFYAAFPDESKQDTDQTPTAAYVTALDSFATAVQAMLTIAVGGRSGTISPIIYHRKTNTWDVITAGRGNKKWGTQRRRGNYGRSNTAPF